MRKITIITAGKLKEPHFRAASEEYRKRLSSYCELQIREYSEDRLFPLQERKGFVISLEIEGKECSSEEFAKELENLSLKGESHLIFLIGGSDGMCEEVKQKADLALSFSRMTFPHELMRVILLEQIYRAFRILRKEPYHK